jgi:hypothetical protein
MRPHARIGRGAPQRDPLLGGAGCGVTVQRLGPRAIRRGVDSPTPQREPSVARQRWLDGTNGAPDMSRYTSRRVR